MTSYKYKIGETVRILSNKKNLRGRTGVILLRSAGRSPDYLIKSGQHAGIFNEFEIESVSVGFDWASEKI